MSSACRRPHLRSAHPVHPTSQAQLPATLWDDISALTHPPRVTLLPGSPLITFAICLEKYGTIDEDLKQALSGTWPAAAETLAEQSPT
ncbi:hypothetical protein B0H14DRAFT_3473523 [Mycena olivaceomarginata]|nr:hypothetical protein B0H14DRAFT_3473523 [Mycena olivaceomarginata]